MEEHEYVEWRWTTDRERTPKQQNAIEVFCREVAERFNGAGYSVKLVLEEVSKKDIPWTQAGVKEIIWRNVQRNMVKKESTTRLTTKEVNEIYEVINESVLSELGIYVPFPEKDR